MRKFFVCFLLLGVFTLTTHPVSAGAFPSPAGSWEMVSIDGKPVTEHLWKTVSIDGKPFMEYLWERVTLELKGSLFGGKSVAELLGGDFSSIETEVTQNDFVLFENGSWFWTLGLNMKADLGGGLSLRPRMSLASAGSYTQSAATIVIVQEDLNIELEPEDFWESAGALEEDLRKAIIGDPPLGKVGNWKKSFSDNTLLLTSTDGIKHVVLKRKDLQKDDLGWATNNYPYPVEDYNNDPIESYLAQHAKWIRINPESIVKDARKELVEEIFQNAEELLQNSNSFRISRSTVTDGSKRLEELQRLKAEAEAELKHVERLRRLKVEIIEELSRLEELQRLKIKMVEELEPDEVVIDANIFEDANKSFNPRRPETFDGIYDRSEFVRTGTDYALLFATDEYAHWESLSSPINDAEAIGAELADRYGFNVDIRKNMTRAGILQTLAEYATKSYQPGDQLFIYFAGNGDFSEKFQDGYIAASDSELPADDPSHATYLSYARLRDDLDRIACGRVLLALDVCYGGTFDANNALIKAPPTRGVLVVKQPSLDLNQTLKVNTRWYLSSGGMEEVFDGVGEHSPFALSLLTILRNGAGEDGVLTIPEIERQLPIKLREEIDKLEVAWKEKNPLWDGKLKQTPASGPFGSGKAADKAFVFIGKDFVKINNLMR